MAKREQDTSTGYEISQEGETWKFRTTGIRESVAYKSIQAAVFAAKEHTKIAMFFLVLTGKEEGKPLLRDEIISLRAITIDEAFTEAKKYLVGDPKKWVVVKDEKEGTSRVLPNGGEGYLMTGVKPVFARIMVGGGFLPLAELFQEVVQAEGKLVQAHDEKEERKELERLKAKYEASGGQGTSA